MENKVEYELIKQGAEARLFKTTYLGKPTIVKERFQKKYRIPELDDRILKDRTKAEVKGLLRSKIAGVSSPALYLVDMESRKIYMEYIDGISVEDYIDKLLEEGFEGSTELFDVAVGIGEYIARIHNDNLIHGDLTTSNLLIYPKQCILYLIDFGLSYVSSSAEDKGVDLYVLERALTSTHECADKIFENILKSYSKTAKGSKEVLMKFGEIKARGRKRTMVG